MAPQFSGRKMLTAQTAQNSGVFLAMNAISNWAGQVTTGHGAMVLVGTLLACLHGDMTWAAGAPLLAAGFIGVIWPENTGLAAQAGKIATDAQPLLTDLEPAVRRALASILAPRQPPAAPAAPPAPPATAGTVSLRGALLLGALALLPMAHTMPQPFGYGALALALLMLAIVVSCAREAHPSRRAMGGVTRRRALGGAAGLLGVGALLDACSSGDNALATPAQIIADATGAVSVLQTTLPLMAAADPNLMTPATQARALADLGDARVLVAGVTPQIVARQGAMTLQKVEMLTNAGLDATEAVATADAASPLAPYALPILAITVLTQGVETWINTTLGATASTAAARAKAVAPPDMTLAKARKILGIGVVS